MKDTRLFKSLSKAVRVEDHGALANALLDVRNRARWRGAVDTNQTSLVRAFRWDLTPQGFAYWKTLHDRLKDEGWTTQVSLC